MHAFNIQLLEKDFSVSFVVSLLWRIVDESILIRIEIVWRRVACVCVCVRANERAYANITQCQTAASRHCTGSGRCSTLLLPSPSRPSHPKNHRFSGFHFICMNDFGSILRFSLSHFLRSAHTHTRNHVAVEGELKNSNSI